MNEDRNQESRFTTMVDLYGLPTTFPGWEESSKKTKSIDKINILESALQTTISEKRFLSYIQLHEFEALLYCDLEELRRRISGSDAGIKALQKEVMNLEPEEINEGATTAPSKRIIRHVPIYERNKVRVGAPAAAAIGLEKLRAKCPHFNQWLSRLEAFGSVRPTD